MNKLASLIQHLRLSIRRWMFIFLECESHNGNLKWRNIWDIQNRNLDRFWPGNKTNDSLKKQVKACFTGKVFSNETCVLFHLKTCLSGWWMSSGWLVVPHKEAGSFSLIFLKRIEIHRSWQKKTVSAAFVAVVSTFQTTQVFCFKFMSHSQNQSQTWRAFSNLKQTHRKLFFILHFSMSDMNWNIINISLWQ